MSFTNASPTTFPTRAGEKGIGNNPLSFIAEGENGDGFALDMACSTVAYGKVSGFLSRWAKKWDFLNFFRKFF
jgi:LDH2 family malate/lactate/ureidoglycolate dehydrogenase